jgi:hypothetical protein
MRNKSSTYHLQELNLGGEDNTHISQPLELEPIVNKSNIFFQSNNLAYICYSTRTKKRINSLMKELGSFTLFIFKDVLLSMVTCLFGESGILLLSPPGLECLKFHACTRVCAHAYKKWMGLRASLG